MINRERVLTNSQVKAICSSIDMLSRAGIEFDRFTLPGNIVVAQCYKCEDIEVLVKGHTAEEYTNIKEMLKAYSIPD